LPVGIAYNPSKLDLFASCAFAWLYALSKGHSGLTLARRARKSRRAAIAFEQRYALTYGAKGRITNLRQMIEAMAQ
jgi:hypothetical protein